MGTIKERLKAQFAAEQQSLTAVKEPVTNEIEDEEKAKLQVLVSAFTEDQLDRYEAFRRSAFPKSSIKKLVHSVSGVTAPTTTIIAISGIAKVLVGQLVEEALDVQSQCKESGAIHPKHVRDAVRRMKHKGILGIGKHKKHKLKRL